MNNLVAMPLVLPVLVAVVLIFFRRSPIVQRVLVVMTMFALIAISIVLLRDVHEDGIQRLDFGGWEAPFGILFVADPLAVLLVLVVS